MLFPGIALDEVESGLFERANLVGFDSGVCEVSLQAFTTLSTSQELIRSAVVDCNI